MHDAAQELQMITFECCMSLLFLLLHSTISHDISNIRCSCISCVSFRMSLTCYYIDLQEQNPRSVANTLYSRSFSPKTSVTISTFSPPSTSSSHGSSAPSAFTLTAAAAARSKISQDGSGTTSSVSTSPRVSTSPWSEAPTRSRGYAHSPDPMEERRCGVASCMNVDSTGHGLCAEHANRGKKRMSVVWRLVTLHPLTWRCLVCMQDETPLHSKMMCSDMQVDVHHGIMALCLCGMSG